MQTAKWIAMLLLATLVTGGCSYSGEAFSGMEATSPGLRSHEATCTWLPGEGEEWQQRRRTVRDKVHRLVVPSLRAAELDAWLLVERGFQHDPMLDSIGISEPGDKAVLFADGGGGFPRSFPTAAPVPRRGASPRDGGSPPL